MCSELRNIGANNIKGIVNNPAILFNKWVIVGVNSRENHPISNHIVSYQTKKNCQINGIFTTMDGSRNIIHKVWKAIELEVEKNNKNNIRPAVKMVANYALDFVKSNQDLKPCRLYIIGNYEKKITSIWLFCSIIGQFFFPIISLQ